MYKKLLTLVLMNLTCLSFAHANLQLTQKTSHDKQKIILHVTNNSMATLHDVHVDFKNLNAISVENDKCATSLAAQKSCEVTASILNTVDASNMMVAAHALTINHELVNSNVLTHLKTSHTQQPVLQKNVMAENEDNPVTIIRDPADSAPIAAPFGATQTLHYIATLNPEWEKDPRNAHQRFAVGQITVSNNSENKLFALNTTFSEQNDCLNMNLVTAKDHSCKFEVIYSPTDTVPVSFSDSATITLERTGKLGAAVNNPIAVKPEIIATAKLDELPSSVPFYVGGPYVRNVWNAIPLVYTVTVQYPEGLPYEVTFPNAENELTSLFKDKYNNSLNFVSSAPNATPCQIVDGKASCAEKLSCQTDNGIVTCTGKLTWSYWGGGELGPVNRHKGNLGIYSCDEIPGNRAKEAGAEIIENNPSYCIFTFKYHHTMQFPLEVVNTSTTKKSVLETYPVDFAMTVSMVDLT